VGERKCKISNDWQFFLLESLSRINGLAGSCRIYIIGTPDFISSVSECDENMRSKSIGTRNEECTRVSKSL